MMLVVMTGPEDGVFEILGEYEGVEGTDEVEGLGASGKKYGESEVEGVDNDDDCADKLAGFWFCGGGSRPADGVRGAMIVDETEQTKDCETCF